MILFGITTFMFALGIVALVLKTELDLELFTYSKSISDATEGVYFNDAYYYAWATITCLMVRLHDAFMPPA
jgi:hypothetical protein